MARGTLYLIPTLLSEADPAHVLPQGTLEVIRRLTVFIVEDERSARRFLIKAGTTHAINNLIFHPYNEHSDPSDVAGYLEEAIKGTDTGLLSDAGVPCVADPGSPIVMAAHEYRIRVVPLSGPSSILLALMASGLNGQGFVFHGYLPAERNARMHKLKELERMVKTTGFTQIFIETPYRNLQMLESILIACSGGMKVCIACDLTSSAEMIMTCSIDEWKTLRPDIGKRPAIFLLGH